MPQSDGRHVRTGFEELYARQGVEHDDWESEAIAAAIQTRLKAWAKALSATPPELAVPAADCDRCLVARLRPATDVVYEAGSLTVRRAAAIPVSGSGAGRGSEVLASELERLLTGLPRHHRRVAFKLYRVEPQADGTRITARYSASGEDAEGLAEQHSTWSMVWALDHGALDDGSLDPSPRLRRLEVTSHEETRRRGGPLLADCTESVLGLNPSWAEQLQLPLHHWWRTLDRMSGVTFRGYQGLSVGDLNGDGLDDLFVAQPGGLPDRLFLQQDDGTAVDVSAEAGVDYLELTRSALIVDLDNDGDQDLATVRSAHVVILANDGKARFRPVAALPLEGAVGVSAADYDGDGDLDLYGVGYRNPDEGQPPTPYYDAENGQRNHLYRNEGGLQFTDVTAQVGLDHHNRRFSFSAVWEDYDNDGDPDLYVANDFGRNNLFENDAGRFEDVAARAGVEDISAGMGASWGDFDLDGQMDLYVSNMFSSAGGRVTYQRRFRSDDASDGSEERLDLFRRHARGNSLFRNLGDGTFVDSSEEAGVTMGRWAWGAIFADLDNSGHPDLVVPNGFLTNEGTDDL